MKKAVLQRRLDRHLQARPAVHDAGTARGAHFGELLARYKYLHELAVRDRSLVTRVEDCCDQVAKQRQQLVGCVRSSSATGRRSATRRGGFATLEESRATNLSVVKRSAQETEARLVAVGRDETRLTNVIAAFEEARRKRGRAA